MATFQLVSQQTEYQRSEDGTAALSVASRGGGEEEEEADLACSVGKRRSSILSEPEINVYMTCWTDRPLSIHLKLHRTDGHRFSCGVSAKCRRFCEFLFALWHGRDGA